MEYGVVFDSVVVIVCGFVNVVFNVEVFSDWNVIGYDCMCLLCVYLKNVCYMGIGNINDVLSFSC